MSSTPNDPHAAWCTPGKFAKTIAPIFVQHGIGLSVPVEGRHASREVPIGTLVGIVERDATRMVKVRTHDSTESFWMTPIWLEAL